MKTPLLALAALLFAATVWAGKPPVFATAEGALRGYDPVAYFTESKPVPGSDRYAFEWQGQTFKFASPKHRSLFVANPEKYAPQYGGYCAYAVSEGYTASTVPDAWRIVDGKLYLNYSASVQKVWSKDIPDRIRAANRNWPGVLE